MHALSTITLKSIPECTFEPPPRGPEPQQNLRIVTGQVEVAHTSQRVHVAVLIGIVYPWTEELHQLAGKVHSQHLDVEPHTGGETPVDSMTVIFIVQLGARVGCGVSHAQETPEDLEAGTAGE